MSTGSSLACQRQLAAHLERLPHEGSRSFVIGRQERCRAAERGWSTRSERIAARPQQQSVKQRDAERPAAQGDNRHTCRHRVLARTTTERQVVVEISPHRARLIRRRRVDVCDRVAKEGLEHTRGDAASRG
eukprot:3212228-Prymnesium_polylepis.1